MPDMHPSSVIARREHLWKNILSLTRDVSTRQKTVVSSYYPISSEVLEDLLFMYQQLSKMTEELHNLETTQKI